MMCYKLSDNNYKFSMWLNDIIILEKKKQLKIYRI